MWTTIRVTYDGNQVQIFIDGKQDGSLQVSAAKLESEEDITIGTRFTDLQAESMKSRFRYSEQWPSFLSSRCARREPD
jgi:hypothetical protein